MTQASSEQALVTAVVVNYNYAQFVGQAVDSVLDQTLPFAQVIVVNDGSTDESLAVLAGYGEAITVVDIQNSGQLGASHAGLQHVRTEYVYFLDADDFAKPDLHETIQHSCRERPAKIQFQLQGVDDVGDDLQSVFPTFPDPYTTSMMRQDNRSRGFYVCPPTSGNVYSVAALRSLDWDDLDLRDFSDGVPAMVMPEIGRVVTIRRPLANYRVHGASDSQYSKPRPEMMRRDRERFRSRWSQAKRQFPLIAAPDPDSTEYEAELDFLEEALSDKHPTVTTTRRYAQRIKESRESPKRKTLLIGWVFAVAAAPRERRWQLVASRRSSANRSGAMNAFLDKVLRRG